jgi:ubiquinone/menaquinone biosynthesis C-methylase UbiE
LEYSYYLLGNAVKKTVLDYGCGAGENSVLIAHHGGMVKGVDISPELLEIARRRLSFYKFGDNSEFLVGSAYKLPLPDESIDTVFGMAILHHLDLDAASKEVFRVLKKGGRAIFQEPVRNSKLINLVRNLIPYRQPDVSPFERPLTDAELEKFAENFSASISRAFALPYISLAELTPFLKKKIHYFYRLDYKILSRFPRLKYYATIRVVELTK